jgi:uncharacterized MAPEG superfamily protein
MVSVFDRYPNADPANMLAYIFLVCTYFGSNFTFLFLQGNSIIRSFYYTAQLVPVLVNFLK